MLSKRKHFVIVVPGLGDDTGKLRLMTNHWKKHGLVPVVTSVRWQDGTPFQPKLRKLTALVDQLVKKGHTVSLVGASAGGSAVINLFCRRPKSIHGVVAVCARLRVGSHRGFRSFDARTASSPAFAQSVTLCEKNVSTILSGDKKRILTVRAMFGDELVPADTATIAGAHNTQVPTGEHMFSIALALTVCSKPIRKFLVI